MLVELTDFAKSDIKSILNYTKGQLGKDKCRNTITYYMIVYKTSPKIHSRHIAKGLKDIEKCLDF